MTITNPTQLVDEFKKSGEFDRLRRELLLQFQRGDRIDEFVACVEDIARQRLSSEQKLQYMPPEAVHRELMQEMDRYPLVERAVADMPMLSDATFALDIKKSVQKLLEADRHKSSQGISNNMDGMNGTPNPIATTQAASSAHGTSPKTNAPPSVTMSTPPA